MIHLIVKVGSGQKRGAVITDPLIPDLTTANIRARQELAKSTYITVTKTLALPHDPLESHACYTNSFSYQPLSIYGTHVITTRTISLTPEGGADAVTLEQYRIMEV
jgi:hypothetical protein